MAFYRKYTEGMLRRYMYRSMEIGQVPSLLGDFSFRGRSSNRKAYTFEDSVIFVYDVERCLARLNRLERELVGRIALQEYTLAETAALTGMSMRTVVRRYSDALDRLTQCIFAAGAASGTWRPLRRLHYVARVCASLCVSSFLEEVEVVSGGNNAS